MSPALGSPPRGRVDFGRPVALARFGGVALRWDLRAALVSAGLLLAAVVLAVLGLGMGEVRVPVGEVVPALFGRGDPLSVVVVREWRLPRTLCAVVLGAALGASGAIMQSLTRNPLGSPDIIGFDAGSYTGALIVIILFGGSYAEVAGGGLVGGLLTALLVYLLAFRRGVQGFRLIIVGIGMSAMLSAVSSWLILKSNLDVVIAAAVWAAGSLNNVDWSVAAPATLAVGLLLAAAFAMSGPMLQLELGDDAATASGVRTERVRLALLVLSVAATATVTAASGPIAFVALAAPQLAKRAAGSQGVGVGAAAAMGAFLLAAADFTAEQALPVSLPVGVLTVVIGGCYLIWLLVHEARRRP